MGGRTLKNALKLRGMKAKEKGMEAIADVTNSKCPLLFTV